MKRTLLRKKSFFPEKVLNIVQSSLYINFNKRSIGDKKFKTLHYDQRMSEFVTCAKKGDDKSNEAKKHVKSRVLRTYLRGPERCIALL